MGWWTGLIGRDTASKAEVDGTFFALNVRGMPLNHGAFGHYRVNHRFAIIAAQAANSRLFELRNTSSNLIILTRLNIRWLQTAAHTAAIEDSIDMFKCTSFTAVDTTNTVTPVASAKRNGMAAAPGNVAIRGVTVAGAAAGMTGGTLTKDGGSVAQLCRWLLAAVPTAGDNFDREREMLDDVNGTHPFSYGANEGFILENRVLLGAAAGSSVYVDLSYAEVDPNKY
jgi:hypothetical protein